MAESLSAAFLLHRRSLMWSVMRIVRDPQTAEDLAQETYLRAARAAESGPIEHLEAFLYQTARNLALDHLRRQRTRGSVQVDGLNTADIEKVQANIQSPEAAIIERERFHRFWQALSSLPERAQTVAVLSRVEGWQNGQIANHLGVSERTVFNDLKLAMAHCRDALEALEWLARSQNAPLELAEQQRFKEWLLRSPRHREEFSYLESMWENPELRRAAEGMSAAARGSINRRRLLSSARHPHAWSLRGVAAAAVLMIAIGVWQYPTLMLRWRADYITATGGRAQVSLPDGSTMLLNTASAVSIDFKSGQRLVTLLEGEAFFDVRHDPAHPFRVAGHFGETEVKGTAFAIRTEGDQDTVVLERGRVEVSRLSDSGDHVELHPGEMVTANAKALSAVAKRDPLEMLAWREGRIIFENQRLARVLNELRRYYDGIVIVADRRVGDLVVTGNYRLDDVPGAIRTLADAAGATMNRLPGGIILLR
jgi:transmembrane sensor